MRFSPEQEGSGPWCRHASFLFSRRDAMHQSLFCRDPVLLWLIDCEIIGVAPGWYNKHVFLCFNRTLVRTGVWRRACFCPRTQNCRKKQTILKKGAFIFCAKPWYAPNPGPKRSDVFHTKFSPLKLGANRSLCRRLFLVPPLAEIAILTPPSQEASARRQPPHKNLALSRITLFSLHCAGTLV